MIGAKQRNIKKVVDDFFTAYPVKKVVKGEIIFYPGDSIKQVFYLTEGTVAQYDISPAGNEVFVNEFKPLAFFSMSTAINETPNDYFFEALESVSAHVAPIKDTVNFLKQNPDVTYDLLSRVYSGTDGILRRMAHLMGGNATTRLLFELLNVARRGHTTTTKQIRLPLSESDLAKRSGLSRETINRTMKRLKQAGLVTVEKNVIIIDDLTAIERALGSGL